MKILTVQAPTVSFAAVDVQSVHVAALTPDTFVIAYNDKTNGDVSFQIYGTNGTQLLAETDVDTEAGILDFAQVSVSAFNFSCFVIVWGDNDADSADVEFAVYNSTGSLLTGPTTVDNDVSDVSNIAGGIQVSCFNDTYFVVAFYDEADYDDTFAVYTSAGTLIAGPIDVDNNVGDSARAISVSCLNSTYFVFAGHDETDDDVTSYIYTSAGTLITGPTDVDTSVSTGYCALSVSALNETHYVIGYTDWISLACGTIACVYDTSGNLKTGPITVDADNFGTATALGVCVSALNSTAFSIGWADLDADDLSFRTYLSDGTSISGEIDIDFSTSDNIDWRYQSVCSQESATALEVYGDNFIFAYANTSSQAVWKAFMINGTEWDGVVPAENTAPSNDACDSDATFTVNIYGWSNMTVTDVDLVANLQTVNIEVNTTGDAQSFTLRWTQTTGIFSEESDASGICTLGTSVRVNVDVDTDQICFNFTISAEASAGSCDVEATTTDDSSETDIDLYVSEFTIAFYSSVDVVTITHSWNLNPGDVNQTISEGTINITVTANAAFNVQIEGSGALTDGNGHIIALANVLVHLDTLASSISLTTDWQNVPGLTSQNAGSNVALTFVLWATSPVPQWAGTYTYTLSVQVIQSS